MRRALFVRRSRILTLGGGLALLLEGSALASCPAASPLDAVAAADRALMAFQALDQPGFAVARAQMREDLGCLDASPDLHQAAELHAVEALAAFIDRDYALSTSELQAAHESDGTYVFPTAIAPPGGALAQRDAEARARPPAPRAPHGLNLDVFVDGREAPDLPTTRSAVVVLLDRDHRVLWSGWVEAGQPIPAPPSAHPVAAHTGALAPTGSSHLRGPRPVQARPWLISSGVSAVTAGVVGGLALWQEQRTLTSGALIASQASDAQWEDALGRRRTAEEVGAMYDRTIGLGVGAVVLGTAAVGLGVVGVAIRW